ncbi:hypothetical protein GOB93_18835 [Acetobacter musti]|uniref:Uncharacterized protein n=1 Tax=Acetobacter musti TaxID=864732 RepID=A0ABX0JV16_9PROT|nr:hypothetical protein [Acetobacter musti]NHN86667.1 hypothetical protein [Acetobacter musti]
MSAGAGPDRKPRFFRRTRQLARLVIGDPRNLIAWRDLKKNASLIEILWKALAGRGTSVPDFHITDGGRIDVEATAATYGVEARAVTIFLDQRQRQTYARSVWAGALDLALIVAWIVEMSLSRWGGTQLLAALEFAPFWFFLALVAFQNAWLNWQIRERHLGSATQFLATADNLFPRKP